METHAGRGYYDLASPESLKTGEAEEGITALLKNNPFPKKHPYILALKAVRDLKGPTAYPGSPGFAKALLRPQDHLYLMEKHPQEIKFLHRNFKDDNVHIHFRDGYEGALAISSSLAGRGLVLIDPSFEIKEEYMDCVKHIVKLHKKWPQAVIALWYPILPENNYKEMLYALNQENLPEIDHRTLKFKRNPNERGMQGTGMYLINTPYGMRDGLTQLDKLFQNFIEE